MKKLTLIAIFTLSSLFASSKGSDTAFYRRPYYLGVTVGYHAFTNGVLSGSPHPSPNWENLRRAYVNSGTTFGLMMAFPFAKKMECEIGFDGIVYSGWLSHITNVYSDPNTHETIGMDFIVQRSSFMGFTSRLQFGYEVFRKNNFALVPGVEAWVDFRGKQEGEINPLGLELLAKSYIPVSHGNAAVQTTLIYGITQTGNYVGVRVGFALKGMRVYRHKPKKYYVQTYED